MQKEFSYPLTLSELPISEQRYKLAAKEEDLEFLTQVLKLPKVDSFSFDIKLKNNHQAKLLTIWGNIKAKVELQSVVSLDFFKKEYDFDFETQFYTNEKAKEEMSWDEDAPEVIYGATLDLVNVTIEQLALQLEEYPRKKNEVFYFESEFDEQEEITNNPFDVLAKLKK